MMGKTYHVLSSWFNRRDKLGHTIRTWCKKVDEMEVHCSICDKKIACHSKGYAAISQHVSTSIHINNAAIMLNSKQLSLKTPLKDDKSAVPTAVNDIKPSTSSSKSDSSCKDNGSFMQLFNINEAGTRAELVWALKSVQCNMAASSCDDLKDVFEAMFPGAIPKGFTLGRTKLSYLISEALGPYFRAQLVEKVKKSYYTLLFDETTNSEGKKELQIAVRYWDEVNKEIECHHLSTVFLGHATACDIVFSIKQVINDNELSFKNILMIGSDGPNVNKKVKRLLNNDLMDKRYKPLIDIGSCNIHVIHTAFLKGVEEFGEMGRDLVCDLFYFFKDFPSRWEDFQMIQERLNIPQNKFIKYVPTRWLSLEPAAVRVLNQWQAIAEYFLKFIPTKQSSMMATTKYKRIAKALKTNTTILELRFIVESAKLFTHFTGMFQKSEPLIHILYDELRDILEKIALRICKKDSIDINKEITNNQLLPLSEIDSEALRDKELIKVLSEKDKLCTLQKVQKHYVSAFNHIVKKNCLQTNSLLPHFRYLQPSEISSTASVKSISKIALALPFPDFDIMALKDEWRILQMNIPDGAEKERIDHFWRKIIYTNTVTGEIKYPNISKMIKAALTFSHGNSDVERGFSVSSRVLTEDKASMSEEMLNARLTVKDALKTYKNQVTKVPITKELIKLANNAHRSYTNHLAEQKKRKEEQLKQEKYIAEKKKLEEAENKLMVEKRLTLEKIEKKAETLAKEKKEVQESSDSLFKEANERLKKAIKDNDLQAIRLAQGLLEGANQLRQKALQCEKEALKMNKIVQKRKSVMIEQFFENKIPRKN